MRRSSRPAHAITAARYAESSSTPSWIRCRRSPIAWVRRSLRKCRPVGLRPPFVVEAAAESRRTADRSALSSSLAEVRVARPAPLRHGCQPPIEAAAQRWRAAAPRPMVAGQASAAAAPYEDQGRGARWTSAAASLARSAATCSPWPLCGRACPAMIGGLFARTSVLEATVTGLSRKVRTVCSAVIRRTRAPVAGARSTPRLPSDGGRARRHPRGRPYPRA